MIKNILKSLNQVKTLKNLNNNLGFNNLFINKALNKY